jgi:hypothetical protein
LAETTSLVETGKGGIMRNYTKEAIEDKFQKLLGRINDDKSLLEQAGVEVNDVTLKAFLVGRLDTLIFDLVGSLENRPATKKGREKIIEDLLPKIDSVLRR